MLFEAVSNFLSTMYQEGTGVLKAAYELAVLCTEARLT